jgi:hypothetical protein
MRFNYAFLTKFCEEHKILLVKNYLNTQLNRESLIEGYCSLFGCKNNFIKKFRQLYETGAYCEKCTILKGNEKISKSKTKFDYNFLKNFCNENNIKLTNDYASKKVKRDTIIEENCNKPNCKNFFSKTVRELIKIGPFCEVCSKIDGKEKIKITNLQKYGFENVMQNEEIKQKLKESINTKYGCEYYAQTEEFKKKYETISLEKYGVKHALSSDEVRKKMKETNLKIYGFDNPQKNKIIQEKTKQTIRKKYGVDCYFQTKEYKEKFKETSVKNCGFPHHSQNAEISEKILKNSFKHKIFKLPSGNEIICQGYEIFFLQYLINEENIDESNIIYKRTEVPEIWYLDKNQRKRRHYVDFFIKNWNKCIEVKSLWTKQEKNNVFEKQNAAKDLGLNYEIWIYDAKGKLIEKYT